MNTPTAAPFFIAKVEPDGQQCDAWPEQPLLLSLEQGGIDWPSSCRNGTCRECIEQLEGGRITPATDVYAAGLVLYEAITGAHPFGKHKSADAIYHAQLVEMPPPPSTVIC